MARLTPEQLEQKISAVLREQPARRAPRSLEARVLGEISRRQSLPWWHQSFSYWPNPVRLGFLVIASGFVAVALLYSMQIMGVISQSAVENVFEPVTGAGNTLKAVGAALWSLVSGSLPHLSQKWIYAGLATLGGAYAVMLGLGATAYRVLWQHR